MIPKKIHYVWLGKGKPTPSVNRCIDSWKRVMPDYELKCWNEDNFDIDSVVWVKEAIENKKWAFASDYIRLYALYNEGGIYMDTDVTVYKSFDKFLKHDFFTSVEFFAPLYEKKGKLQLTEDGKPLVQGTAIEGIGLLSALFGASKGNPYIKECMEFYNKRHFVNEDGTFFEKIIIPAVMAIILSQKGFVYKDIQQDLGNGMMVYPSNVFTGDKKIRTEDTYAMHWCDGTWLDRSKIDLLHKIVMFLGTRFPSLFRK